MTGEELDGGKRDAPLAGERIAPASTPRDPLAVLAVRCIYRKSIRRRAATA
jgi:hypothetical protein